MPNLRIPAPSTVARVRSGVAAALVCAVCDLDSDIRRSLPAGRYGLTLSGPGGIRRRLVFRDGRCRERRRGAGSAVLRFLDARSMARALAGGRAAVLPLPAGAFFAKAIRAFTGASRRAAELASRREFADDREKALTTELLLTAALRGVAETAMADPWTAPKAAAMPSGMVQVRIENSSIGAWLECRGGTWRAGRGEAPAEVNARLAFADVETAFGLLTGSVAALSALGRGRVSIRGRLPMIQVLFPLLDRCGELMRTDDGDSEAASA